MAAGKGNEKDQRVRRGGSHFGDMIIRRAFLFPIQRTVMLMILRGIGLILTLLIVWFLLSGQVNQVEMVKSLGLVIQDVGRGVSKTFEQIANGEWDGPIKFTEDGVYLKDAEVPDGPPQGLQEAPEGDDADGASDGNTSVDGNGGASEGPSSSTQP